MGLGTRLVTDVILSIGWVDAQFDPHEDLIGPHHVKDITTDTIVKLYDYVTLVWADTESPYVGLPIPLSSIIIAPPIQPHSNFCLATVYL